MKTLAQRALLFAVVLLAFGASDASASHFRYGTIQWQPISASQPNVIRFTVKTAWRRDFGWGTLPLLGKTINPGSFCLGAGQGCVSMSSSIVTAENATENWIEATFTYQHTYPAVNATYVANHGSCCRIGTLQNGNTGNWDIRTQVQINMASANASPTSGAIPVMRLPINNPANTFSLGASDPNGDPLTYSISPTSESGLSQAAPPGLSINSSTGIVTWNTMGYIAGRLYAVQFKVADNRGATIPVDVILMTVAQSGQPPTMLINGSAATQNFTVTVGQTLTFTVAGTDPENGGVTLQGAGLPAGATMNPLLQGTFASGATSTFSWTPGVANVGSHTLTFSATDNVGLQDTNSATITVATVVAATSTSIGASPNPANVGQNVTLTAIVTSTAAPVGSVQFFVDGVLTGTTQLSPLNGTQSQAQFIVNAPPAGSHSMRATYTGATTGGTTYSSSTSPVGNFVVNNPATTTTVTSNLNPSQFAQNVTFTATVISGAPGTPTGTVQFSDSVSGNLGAPVTLSGGGQATFTTSALSVGGHTITATYSGGGSFTGSSGTVGQTVNKADTTTTGLASPNPSTFGQMVTFTATVMAGPMPAAGGSVVFKNGATIVAGPIALDANGQASFNTTGWPVGGFAFAIEYSGSTNYNPSNGSVAFSVNRGNSLTSITSSQNPSAFNDAVTFTATVAAIPPAFGTPTGMVQFTVNGVNAGPAVPLAGGVATLVRSNLPVGASTISAVYNGDLTFNGSTASLIQSVTLTDPPFTGSFPTVPGACICTPLIMNTDVTGTQYWWVKASGGNLGITAIAHAVNNVDPETVVARVYDPSNALVATLTASYGAFPANGFEASDDVVLPGASGVYRVEVTTPGAVPTQPHYRLKFDGATVAATLSPSSPSFEHANDNRWYFNTAAGEALSVRMSVTGTPADETIQNYTLTDPAGAVTTGTATANTTTDATISGAAAAVAGTWTLELDDASDFTSPGANPANGHYTLNKTGGADRGIHITWESAGEGALSVTAVTSGGAPLLLPLTFNVYDADGAPAGTGSTTTGARLFDKLSVGAYTVEIVPPPGTSVAYDTLRVNVFCDKVTPAEFVVRVLTDTTVVSSQNPSSYGDAVTFTATVQPRASVGVVPTGTMTFTNGATTVTVPLVNGSATYTPPTLAVGSYPISASYGGDVLFIGSSGAVTQVVNPRAVQVTADSKTKVYGDGDPALTYQITGGSLVPGDTFSGGLMRASGENVGTYPINQGTLALSNNYALTFVGAPFTIKARPIQVTADPKTKTYGDGDPALTYTISNGSLAFTDAFSGGLARAAGENVGTYPINQGTLALSNNYALTFTGSTLTITARPIAVAADVQSKTYGDGDPALTYQVTGTLAFTDAFTGALTRVAGEDVGGYAIGQGSLALSSNYALTFTGSTLTITARPIAVAAAAKTKVYGEDDPLLTYQVTDGSLVNGDAFSGALTRVSGDDVGTYAITQGTLALSGNYTLSYVGADLVITKARLTVTADDKSRLYGVANPAFTATFTGFVYGQTLATSGVSGAAALTTTATPSSAVGTHSIEAALGSLASGNYDFAFVNGTLTIAARTTATTVSFAANPIDEGATTIATFTVTDTSGAALVDVTPAGTLALGATGPVTPVTACTLAGASGVAACSVTVQGIDNPSATLNASFPGDATHFVSAGSGVLTINNVAPVITSVNGPAPLAFGSSSTVSFAFTDAGAQDTHECTFTWDDGQTSTVNAAGTGNGSCSASHTYAAAGVYTVGVQVKDKDNATDTDVFQFVVIYDPSGGFVTGGGFINSPAGAYAVNPALTGKANFGFVSKYLPGRTVPTGQTEFQFKAGDLNFHSTVYEWLVVAGSKAQYRGSGRINNAGDYFFMLTAIDGNVSGGGGVDKFRIKIWDKVNGGVIYDNKRGTSDDIDSADPQAISGGSIVIHKN